MTQQLLTDRQLREREFYEEYCKRTAPQEVSFDPADPAQSRPWNSYWYIYEFARRRAGTGKRLLDFGCGPGDQSILFAKMGFDVWGFDITPANVAMAARLAAKYGFQGRTNFEVMSAEALTYPDDFFDVIVGIDILHHVDIHSAVTECLRVLKPGGVAAFREPAEAPLFDALRNSAVGRWLVPKTASLDRHVTEDERKLTRAEIQTMRELCPALKVQPFRLFTRLDKFIPQISALEKLDATIFKWLPFSKPLAGGMVLMLACP